MRGVVYKTTKRPLNRSCLRRVHVVPCTAAAVHVRYYSIAVKIIEYGKHILLIVVTLKTRLLKYYYTCYNRA